MLSITSRSTISKSQNDGRCRAIRRLTWCGRARPGALGELLGLPCGPIALAMLSAVLALISASVGGRAIALRLGRPRSQLGSRPRRDSRLARGRPLA
jgi:hypothetical protein